MAEREGFEPSLEFPLNTLSKRAPSTTRPSLREAQKADSVSVYQTPPERRVMRTSRRTLCRKTERPAPMIYSRAVRGDAPITALLQSWKEGDQSALGQPGAAGLLRTAPHGLDLPAQGTGWADAGAHRSGPRGVPSSGRGRRSGFH